MQPENQSSSENLRNKAATWELWQGLSSGSPAEAAAAFAAVMAPDVRWHGFAPIGSLAGVGSVVDEFWNPFAASFTGLERETHIFFGGQSNGRADGDLSKDGRWWTTGTGLFHAVFENDYLSIPAHGKPVSIRWGEFCRFDDGLITEVYFLIDLIDLIQQAGFEVLPKARGADHVYPPPAAGDGLLHDPTDAGQTAHSLDHIRRFIYDGLNAFDESDLTSMGMADWFHPEAQWYGPGGIGACLSFHEFETLHQQPWLVAYPDRQVQDLDAIIAEGAYSAAPGWAGVLATHTGPYLDVAATGNSIEFNGLDWWKRVDEVSIENWVFVDMIHLFDQFGVDLLSRIHHP